MNTVIRSAIRIVFALLWLSRLCLTSLCLAIAILALALYIAAAYLPLLQILCSAKAFIAESTLAIFMFLTPSPDRRSFVVHTYPHDKMLTAARVHIVELIIKLIIKLIIETAIVAPYDADNAHTQRKKQCLFHRSTPYKLNEMICSEFAVPDL